MPARLRIAAPLATLAFAALTAAVLAGTVTTRYSGRSGPAGTMSFELAGGVVSGFTFGNRCPGSAGGTLVPASMRVAGGRFSYHDAQFTVTGRLLAGGVARGTARDVTGDCDSGTLAWAARASGATLVPSPGELARIVAGFGDPPAAERCLSVRLAASDPAYATVVFASELPSCIRWAFNGANVLERTGDGRWRIVFAGSSYACPVARVPASVQHDLALCPLSRR